MTRGGVPVGTIITAVQSRKGLFDVSPAALVTLHSAGVAEPVLNQMIRATSSGGQARTFGVATGTFPVNDALGKTVRYSCWIKTESVADGYAGLWWRVDGSEKGKVLAFDNSQSRVIGDGPSTGNGVIRGAKGTTGWTRYEFELPVPAGAANINFGVLLTGTGTAWFDSLRIEVNNAAYANAQAFDLDFESGTPRGFYTGGNGYSVALDRTNAWTGNKSLRMRSQ